MKIILEKIFLQQKQKFIEKMNNREDMEVIKFLNTLKKNKNYKYIEVGSGIGRFPLKIKNLYKNLDIECVEINSNLAEITSKNGLSTIIGNASKLSCLDESFDVVHCSHVIEHLKYPDIIHVLDELVRVTKISGYIIIRSPLWHPDFYLDIDHVRPYPPEAILNYFNNNQQQNVGNGNLKIISRWYRRENLKFYNIGSSKIKYFTNALLALLWTYINFPFSKKNGYILILQKI